MNLPSISFYDLILLMVCNKKIKQQLKKNLKIKAFDWFTKNLWTNQKSQQI